MGILDSFKRMSEQNAHSSKLKDFKWQILYKLSTKQLIDTADYFGIKPLAAQAGLVNAAPQRNDYIQSLIKSVDTDSIIDFCQSQGIHSIDILVQGRKEYMRSNNIDPTGKKLPIDEDSLRRKLYQSAPAASPVTSTSQPTPVGIYEPSPLCIELMDYMRSIPQHGQFRDEGEFHTAMLYWLEARYHERVSDEYDRKNIDIKVDNIAIELKCFFEGMSHSGELDRLKGQMLNNADRYEAYIVCIYGGNENDKQSIMSADRSIRKNIRVVLV
jgi:hypothetical protein